MADSMRAVPISYGAQDLSNDDSLDVPSVQLGPGSYLINDPIRPEHSVPAHIGSSLINDPILPLRPIYKVSAHARVSRDSRGALVDRGANGGILGNDARVILQHTREVDVTGIDNHQIPALKLVDASAKATSNRGDVIIILRQYAYHGLGRTIHSAGQLEWYKNRVEDRSMKVNGIQCIFTNDGYIFPLDIINGLPYLKMIPNTDKEFETLPHVIFTSGDLWNPRVLDHVLSQQDNWLDIVSKFDKGLIKTPFDEYGNFKEREPHRIIQELPNPADEADDSDDESYTPSENDSDSDEDSVASDSSPTCPLDELRAAFHDLSDLNKIYVCAETEVTAPEVKPKPIDYEQYRPYFLHAPVEKIRRTFETTTRFASNIMSGHNITQTIKSPYPAHNVWRRNEPVATDTIFSETPAICTGGQKMAQIFVGRKSLVIDVFGMSTEAQFVNTLEDVIRKRGAMDKLISDSAKVEISERVAEILRALCVDDWQSEPNYQHQNPAEHRWQHVKRNVEWYMNHRNVPGYAWLLCLSWVADVMNHTAEKSLGWRPPLQVLTGQTIDISILLIFMFWDVVYCSRYEDKQYKGQIGSQKSSEIRGRFVGFSWSVGHALTFMVLTDDTRQIIHRSRLRLAKVGENNLKLDRDAGAVPERIYIRSKRDDEGDNVRLPTIDMSKTPFDIVFEDDEKEDTSDVTQEKGEQHQQTTPDGKPTVPHGEPTTPVVETVEENEDDDASYAPSEQDDVPLEADDLDEVIDERTPMDDPQLKDMPFVNDGDKDEDISPHLRARRPGERPDPNNLDDTAKFIIDSLKTPNKVEKGLPPEELIDRTFLMPPTEDGCRFRAKILKRIKVHKKELEKDPDLIKFKCRVNDEYDEVVAYNDIVDFIEADESWDGVWKFKKIFDHAGPLNKKTHSHEKYKGTKLEYMGSRYNVQVLWETGDVTWQPLHNNDDWGVYDTDPVTVAVYARENNLLSTPGWELPGLKKMAKTQQRMIRTVKQAQLQSFRTKPIYMYGFLVPRNYRQAIELDQSNGNSKWTDATNLELKQIDDYKTFEDKGKGGNPGKDYKKINVHFVYAVKHDGRHKARLVAGGHLTDTPIDSVYSSVVSLRGIRILAFLAELNDLELWATDIGNAYLESYTKEKVYIKAGPEFGDREGHTLVIVKALYGLKSSGLRWHERFADVLRDMGFFPSRAETDIWMRDKGDHYEYIAVYVDDLMILSKRPQDITNILIEKHCFKLKGTGPVSFHLGCDFFRDEDGNLCFAPKKYIEKTCENYRRIFGTQPKQASSPLVKGDHPELDSSPLLEIDDIKIYQSLIGGLQWVVQIGRFDVATAVMTMSRFRAAPRQGHMERVKRIHGYLSKMRNGVIRIRTEEPDFSDIPEKVYDWTHTCYGGATEEIPTDAPRPLGLRVLLSHCFDANLYHDLISGRSVTGILHMANKTPIDWYSKLQSTVETATFGSEYVAGRTCIEQVIDLRNTFRYLGVPVEGPSYVFGDNETIINTASIPHSRLNKRHNALSYHRVRESIAAGIARLFHIRGKTNPADILSKHWDYPSVWPQLRALLFWWGDTGELAKTDNSE